MLILIEKAVIYTINSGADYQQAGPLHLAGDAISYRTPLPKKITDFEQFKVILNFNMALCGFQKG